MDALIYFLIKYFPIWAVSVMIIIGPLAYNSIINRKYFTLLIYFFIIIFLLFMIYVFIVNDGYNTAVPFIRNYIY